MRTPTEVPALLSIFGDPPTRAAASIVQLTTIERVGRALTGLGTCWGLAVLAIFIPIAHWVLVPRFWWLGLSAAFADSARSSFSFTPVENARAATLSRTFERVAGCEAAGN